MTIRNLRKKRHLTQKELSIMSDIGRASIARYENGTRSPSMATAKRLAIALGCTIDELMADADTVPAKPDGAALVRDVRDLMEER